MRFELRAGPDTRVPLLQGLPSIPLARLEGYNGIGKTLTIRILQLCAGRQPFLGLPRAWTSLKAAIGSLTVEVTELRGADSIKWRLLPDEWPDTPEPQVADSWFSIEVDGKSGSLAQIRQLLAVERLAGDAGLAETLGLQVEADQRTLDSALAPLVKPEESPTAAVLDLLDTAVQLARRIDGRSLLEARKAAGESRQALDVARERLRSTAERLEQLRSANDARIRLEELERVGASLDERIAALDSELRELADRRQPLAAQVIQTEQDASRTREARTALQRVHTRLERHRQAEAQEREAIASLLVGAHLDSPDDVDSAVAAVRAELADLVGRRAAIDAAPLLADVLEDLAIRLERAEDEGLGERRLLDDGGPAATSTVTEWRDRFELQAASLASQSPTTQGAAIVARIDELTRRLSAMDQLRGRVSELQRRRRLAGQAQTEIDELVRDADPHAITKLESLRVDLGEIDRRSQEVAQQRTALASMSADTASGSSPAQLRSDFDRWLKALGVDEHELPTALERVGQVVAAVERDFRNAERAEREATDRLGALLGELDRVTISLAEDSGFEWLRQLEGIRLLPLSASIEQRLDALTKLRGRLEMALDRAGDVGAQVAALSGALRQLGRRLQGLEEVSAPRYEAELTKGYGRAFAEMFNVPALRSALLGEGATVSDVDLRSGQLELRYIDSNGVVAARPLEAFSRGEQAFAYTQARLAALDVAPQAPLNRLVVLDEFGAFIALDRLARLIGLLSEREKTHPEDQILLILPASADYRSQAETSTGKEHERLAALSAELEAQGYVIEELLEHAA